ncbi:hypothetical protein V5O48_019244, partial [Marasmius crinis-equi]
MIFNDIKNGGRAVLDLRARNQAITAKWVMRYADKKHIWTNFLTEICALNTPKSKQRKHNSPLSLKVDPFLQKWKPNLGNNTKLPNEILDMFTVARDLDMRLEALAIPRNLLNEMPMWNHAKADPHVNRQNNSASTRCLLDKHRLRTVGETVHISLLLRMPDHIPHDECECPMCLEINEQLGCDHPHSCALKANLLLDCLPEKWDPRSNLPEDYPETPGEEGWEVFKPALSPAKGFSDL